jgi:Ser/Thr protein kinase RdoA (MazF antagonist)
MNGAGDPVPAGLLADALDRFGVDAGAAVALVRHGENTTYRVDARDGRCFALRIHRPGYQRPAAIRSELAWMDSLRSAGLRTAAALPGRDGDPLQTAADRAGGLVRSVVLFEWIEGVPLSALDELAPWERLGELSAYIHAHARAWVKPVGFTRPAWDADALVGDDPRWGPPDPERLLAPEDRATLEACRAEVRARLDAIGSGRDRFGLVHGDLGFENVLVSGDGEVTIIDFDDCGDSWYLHELAVALYPHVDGGLEARRDALVRGYRRHGELPDELLAELPTFLMARRIQTLGWTFSRPETAHALRQRPRRLQTTPGATREFLAWARRQRRPRRRASARSPASRPGQPGAIG